MGTAQRPSSASSVLDDVGDVVLFTDAATGVRHLFRDGRDNGLVLRTEDGQWTLTKESYVEVDGTFTMVAGTSAVCSGGWARDANAYVARHLPTGRRILRHDTQFGLLARAARFYLR